jgi:uncharacterized protein (DUF433 family)
MLRMRTAAEADILGNYPRMTDDDIIACLAYARNILSSIPERSLKNALSRQRDFATRGGRPG